MESDTVTKKFRLGSLLDLPKRKNGGKFRRLASSNILKKRGKDESAGKLGGISSRQVLSCRIKSFVSPNLQDVDKLIGKRESLTTRPAPGKEETEGRGEYQEVQGLCSSLPLLNRPCSEVEGSLLVQDQAPKLQG